MSSEKIPSLERALAHYALIAHRYDDETRKIEGIRRRATAALALQPGQIVLDVGCGTGACLPALAQQVAPQGLALGLEPSEHLLERARQRVGGIPNVRLMQCAAEQMNGSMLALTHPVDAVLFCYTHDVLQSIAALQKLFAKCKAGARVVAVGTQLLPRWAWPVPQIQRFTHRHYITARDSMNLPYGVLSQFLEGFQSQRVFPWHSYMATGTLKASHAQPT